MKIFGICLLLGLGSVWACSSSSEPSNGGAAGAPSAGAGGAEAGAAGSAAGSPAAGAGTAGAPSGGDAGTPGETCTKCPSACCASGATCADDGLGNLSCKKACTNSYMCPSTSPCCELQPDGSGFCSNSMGGAQCRCAHGTDCSSGACAPRIDLSGNPIGPYICVPNDGGAYHGCSGLLTSCGDGKCCMTDSYNNQFCASQCSNSTQCGKASCNTYSSANTTCSGMLACGPTQ